MSAEERGWGAVERDGDGNIVRVEFVVPGKPMTWARARRGKSGPTFIPAERISKMGQVRDAWQSLEVPPFAESVDLAMSLVVFCIRPKQHFRTNGELKPWALTARPRSGTNGGDLDNFAKLVKDALNLVAYHDDTQIVKFIEPFEKLYVEDVDALPRTFVAFEPVGPVALAEVGGQESLIASG